MGAFPIDHPLLAPFCRQHGTRVADNSSSTLDDFTYTIRVDDDGAIEIREERHSYWDSALVGVYAVRGRAELLHASDAKLVLRIVGTDANGASRDEALVITATDIIRGDVAWALRSHTVNA